MRVSSLSLLLRVAALLSLGLAAALPATAQPAVGTYTRTLTPNGRTVLEIRTGTLRSNANLVYTAVITAGPIAGSTSVLLQSTLVQDLLNPSATPAGFVVVRSSSTAFSLGGGCTRGNTLDFPYINNNRPEFLRIVGTTHSILTPGIAGNNDQYDSIDCYVSRQGNRTYYLLSNRTRGRLELRFEQGGTLQLVRDSFGNILTPFGGAPRPSLYVPRFFPRQVAPRPADAPPAPQGSLNLDNYDLMVMFMQSTGTTTVQYLNASAETVLNCSAGQRIPPPTAFSTVLETALGTRSAAGDFDGDGVIDIVVFDPSNPGCPRLIDGDLGAQAGTLFNWTGPTISQGRDFELIGASTQGIFEPGQLPAYFASPFSNRGGPRNECRMITPDLEGATLQIGVGGANTQVQYTPTTYNFLDIIHRADMDGPAAYDLDCGRQ